MKPVQQNSRIGKDANLRQEMAHRKSRIFKMLLSGIVLLLLYQRTYSQELNQIRADTLNKMDSLGKKTGYWIEYQDKKLLPVKNMKKAVFYMYRYYEAGKRLGPIFSVAGEIYYGVNTSKPDMGKMIMLNGTYSTKFRNGKLRTEDVYLNGHLMTSKVFRKNGFLIEFADYRIKYENQKLSYKITIGDRSYWSCKVNGHWRYLKIE